MNCLYKKMSIFFSLSSKPVHLLQNWIENKIPIFTDGNFFNRIKYFERGSKDYFIQITFFVKKKIFLKIIPIFFLKKIYFFST